MKTISITLDNDQADALAVASAAIKLSPEAFLQRTLARALAEADAEYGGPVQAIKAGAYRDACPPFHILQSLGSKDGEGIADFDPPLALSRSNLLRLQERGVVKVNLRF